MLKHIKTWLPSYIPGAVGIAAIILQVTDQYLTTHKNVDFGALIGLCVMAVVNHNITAPKNSAVVDAAKREDIQNGTTN